MFSDASPAPGAAAAAAVYPRSSRTTAAPPMEGAGAAASGCVVRLTERQRLLGALRERAAAAAVAASVIPREGAAQLQAALAEEHSSLMRCLNLLEEEQVSVVSPQGSEGTKSARKRLKKLKPQRRHSDTQSSTVFQDKSLKVSHKDRKWRNPTTSSRCGRSKTVNSQREDVQNNFDILVKQRNIKATPKKTFENGHKVASGQTRNTKQNNDKKKKKALKINKSLVGDGSRNSLSRDGSPLEERKTTKQRNAKVTQRNKSTELVVATLDNVSSSPNRTAGDAPKKITKQQRGKLRKTTTFKNLTAPLAISNFNRNMETKKPQIIKRCKQKRQQKPVQKAITYTSLPENEIQPPSSGDGIVQNEPIIKQANEHNTEELNQPKAGEATTNVSDSTPGTSNAIVSLLCQKSDVVAEETKKFELPLVRTDKQEPESLDTPAPQEGPETCLRSILRDTNKKLVGLGNKTVRFYEDTITTPKKVKKRKIKITNKTIASEKAAYKKSSRPLPSLTKLVYEPMTGRTRISTSPKAFDLVKKKKRSKAAVKEKNEDPNVFQGNVDALDRIINDTVVEVTPYLQNQTLYRQDRSLIGKSVADTMLPITENAQDMKTTNTTATKAINSSRAQEEATQPATSCQCATSASVAVTTNKYFNGKLSSRSSNRIKSARTFSKIYNTGDLIKKPFIYQKNSWKNMMNRYSNILDEMNKTSAEKVLTTGPKLSTTSIKPITNRLPASEETPKRISTANETRKRSTKKNTNIISRHSEQQKQSSNGLQTHLLTKTEEKYPLLGNVGKTSVSQTSLKNVAKQLSEMQISPRLSRTNVRDALGPANYQKLLDSAKLNCAILQRNNANTFTTKSESCKLVCRSASTSRATAKNTATSNETKYSCDAHKMNIPEDPTERNPNSTYNWQRGTFQVMSRKRSGTDLNAPKWITDAEIISIPSTSSRCFLGRSTRRSGHILQRERISSTSHISEISDYNELSDQTITSGGDFPSTRAVRKKSSSLSQKVPINAPIYRSHKRIHFAKEELSLPSSGASQRTNNVSFSESYPQANAYSKMENTTDVQTARDCPNCTPDYSCWQHMPTIKYLLQSYTGELPVVLSTKNYQKNFNAGTKNKSVHESKPPSGVLSRNERLVEKESDVSLSPKTSSDLDKGRKKITASSTKTRLQKYASYSSELDDDTTNSSRRSRRSAKESHTKKKKKTSASSDRSIDNARSFRSLNWQPLSTRQRSSFNSLIDNRIKFSSSKKLKASHSITKPNAHSNTSFSGRKPNTRDLQTSNSNHFRLSSGSTSRISNTSRSSQRQSSRPKNEDTHQMSAATTHFSQQTIRRNFRKKTFG